MGVFETIEVGGGTSRVYAAGDAGPGIPGVVAEAARAETARSGGGR